MPDATTVTRPPLRTRQPRGLLPATDATARLAPLVGATLAGVEVSLDRPVLVIAATPEHRIVTAAPVTITSAPAQREGGPGPASPRPARQRTLADLVGQVIHEVAVEPDGRLRLTTDWARVCVESDPHHEAWEVRALDGALLACLPGGAVSLWTATPGTIPAGT